MESNDKFVAKFSLAQKDALSPEDALRITRVPVSFFQRPALEVARDILGLVVVHRRGERITAGIITETEAYQGPQDQACHAYNGRRTERNEALWGPPGRAYIYFTYGMHHMFNVVSYEDGIPHGVLVRSLWPVTGLSLMLERRKGRLPLATGPGRLCQAMDITREHYGARLQGDTLFVGYPPLGLVPRFDIISTPRIGIDYAGDAKDYLWRFVMVPSPGGKKA